MRPLNPLVIRAVGFFGPALLCAALIAWRRPPRRVLLGSFLAFMWNLTALLPVNLYGQGRWWAFGARGGTFLEIPVDLWVGWALLWGPAALLVFPRGTLFAAALTFLWLDALLMPLCAPVVALFPGWLTGEAVALMGAFFPGYLLGIWTAHDRRLAWRVTLLTILAGGLLLGVAPVVVLALAEGEVALPHRPAWSYGLFVQLMLVPATVSISAVQEFLIRGRGTPLPYDPPRHMVTSGVYAYVSNPMQLSMSLLLLGATMFFISAPLGVAACVTIAYSAGIAAWHEEGHLAQRFGVSWVAYRREVRAWLPRWRPYVAKGSVATLYIAASCSPCSRMGRWITRRRPIGLRVAGAEALPQPPRRLTYVGADGSLDRGVSAAARALEHINLGWAVAGWVMRLPGLNQLITVIGDTVGAGPKRLVPSNAGCCAKPHADAGSRSSKSFNSPRCLSESITCPRMTVAADRPGEIKGAQTRP